MTTLIYGKVFFNYGSLGRIESFSLIHFLFGGFAGLFVTISGATILLLGFFLMDGSASRISALSTDKALALLVYQVQRGFFG